jgi:hypothetical protein
MALGGKMERRQRWAAFSVKAHRDLGSLAADIPLYVRISCRCQRMTTNTTIGCVRNGILTIWRRWWCKRRDISSRCHGRRSSGRSGRHAGMG